MAKITVMRAPSGRLFEFVPSEVEAILALERLGWVKVPK